MAYRRDQGPKGGAEHLARIHGTEEDKVNCPFYFKIGACRHGDRCSRQHHRPPFSQTILVQHMWQNPLSTVTAMGVDPSQINEQKVQEDFDEFYEEVFEELQSFGKIEEVQICENLGDHMVGNVYVKYADEEDAEKALSTLFGRYYAGRPLVCEYSPVTDFREARCRQYDEGTCSRGGYCNFMHVREASRELRKHLEKKYNFRSSKLKGVAGGGGRGDRGGGYDRGGGGHDRGGDRFPPAPMREREKERSRSRDKDRSDRPRERSRSRDGGDRGRHDQRRREDEPPRDRDRERDGGDRREDPRRREDDRGGRREYGNDGGFPARPPPPYDIMR